MNASVAPRRTRLRRPRLKTLLGVGALVVATAGLGYLALRPVGVVVARVVRGALQPTIQGVGTVEAKVAVSLGARVGGRLAAVLVDQGDEVRAGQVLARLDDNQQRAEVQRAAASLLVARAQHKDARAGTRPEELAEAQANVARAQALAADLEAGPRAPELEELRERVRAARATRELNAVTLSRTKALASQGASAVHDLDRARQALDVAVAQEKGAEQALHLAEEGARKHQIAAAHAQSLASQRRLALLRVGTRPHQVLAADARVAEAAAALVLAKERLADTVITSPLDGYVVTRLLEPGAVVSAGTPLLKVADPRTAWVTVHVDEHASASIAVGHEATLTLRSQRSAPMKGRVARIQREADRVTEQLAIDVAFATPPRRLILGEQAEAVLLPPAHADALTVPAGAIVRRAEGPGVLTVEEGLLRFRRVEFGLADAAGRIELTGLDVGATVVVAPGALAEPTHEGRRVRVRRVEAER